MIFDERKLKSSYVGIVYIFDLKTKKVLLQGGGHFDVTNRKLDVLFDCSEIYKDVEWVPILQTEAGYFCPAQATKGHLVGFGIYAFDHRNKFSMSSYFHWPSSRGIEYITEKTNSVVIDVDGAYSEGSFMKFAKDWSNIEMTSRGVTKDLAKATLSKLTISLKAFANTRAVVEQKVRFRITAKSDEFSFGNWLPVVHAFRLYWLFQHHRADCHTTNFALGESLTLVTDMMQLKGYDDNTEIVQKALPIEAEMNPKLLAKTLGFFLDETQDKKHAGIEFGFYRLLGYRFNLRPKRLGDDVLDLIFALDGFCADINKKSQRKLSKPEKKSAMESIEKVIDSIKNMQDEIDPIVYDFYHKPASDIFQVLTHKPYTESVRQCFESLGVDYDEYDDIVVAMNKVRQIFVHGKGYDTSEVAGQLYTRGTTKLQEQPDGIQVIFGQTTGLSERYYKMIHLLFSKYFVT